MKKFMFILAAILLVTLASCAPAVEIECGRGTVEQDGQCVPDTLVCEEGYHKEDGACVLDEEVVECDPGYHEDNGSCVVDEVVVECDPGYHEENGSCVIDVVVEIPDWFDEYHLLSEPSGDKALSDFTFTETGFSVYVGVNERVGIQMSGVTLEPGYYYEVTFEYSSDAAGKGVFVQLEGHGGNQFTNPGTVTTESTETFSQILPFPPAATLTNDGIFTIELTPSGVAGTVTIENIDIIKTALPTCGENEELSGIECIAANNGYIPNGTPTAWFDGWELLTIPPGNKEITDLDFTETGYTVYLGEGDRSGIQLMNYVFESGYTYTISFDYTAGVAGRQVWVQMVALGGYEFTNTDTWTIEGTASFSQSLVIPSSYTPSEPGWIKLELTPGALDNITIENLVITKTAN